jgi:hypothetical protein
MPGEKRQLIMDLCPEDFTEILGRFIDDVEQDVCGIRDLLDISRMDELDQIEDAHSAATDLADSLY